MSNSNFCWVNRVRKRTKPVHAAILTELEHAIASGELQAGDQLPRQRELAEQLGIDLTTVARAYSTARVQGLVVGARGRGTYVANIPVDPQNEMLELGYCAPPPPRGLSLEALVSESAEAIMRRSNGSALMGYRHVTAAERAAGALWLSRYGDPISPDHLLICSGGHAALTATLSTIFPQGGSLVVEPLTYPGVIAIATRLGVKLIPCPTDNEGFRPDELERICATHRPTALLVTPTMQNPTAVDMPAPRRAAVHRIAAGADMWIIENDPFAPLVEPTALPFVSIDPARTFHIATLSKALSPGFRIAYIVAPSGMEHRLADGLRAFDLMTPPLLRAIVTRWIQEGIADQVLKGVREEARVRRKLAADILPRAQGGPESLHVWLPLSHRGEADRLRLIGRDRGLDFHTGSAFAVGENYSDGIRVGLGHIEDRATLERALRSFEGLLSAVHPRPILI